MKKTTKAQLAAAGVFGAVSGALALYLSHKPELRKELTESDTPSEALQHFGDHLQKDGTGFMDHLRSFFQSERDSVKKQAKKGIKKIRRAKDEMAMAAAKETDRAEEMVENM